MTERAAPRFAVTRAPRQGDVAAPLLEYLRERLDAPALGYAELPAQIFGGFDTAIFGFALASDTRHAGRYVVRIFRSPEDATRAADEAALQGAIASLGFPAPAIIAFEAASDVLGAPFIVMARIPGVVMLDALIGPRMGAMAALLGRTHAQLHALDASAFRRAAEAAGGRGPASADGFLQERAAAIERCRLDGLRPALAWLEKHRPPARAPDVICHGDFHPLNVLVQDGEVTGVVDWGWVAIAPAEFDVGSTIALLNYAPVSLPRALLPLVRFLRGMITRRYLRAYTALRPLDPGALRYYEALRLTDFLAEAGEQMQAERGIIVSAFDTPFYAPAVRTAALRRLRAIVGHEVALPPSP